jgi:hypothetical protein
MVYFKIGRIKRYYSKMLFRFTFTYFDMRRYYYSRSGLMLQ